MRWILCAAMLTVLAGCQAFQSTPTGQPSDQEPKGDVAPATGRVLLESTMPGDPTPPRAQLPRAQIGGPIMDRNVVPATAVMEFPQPGKDQKPLPMLDRLRFPEGVLPFKVSDIQMPPPTAPIAERQAAIQKQFPALPTIPNLPVTATGPDGRPLSLEGLQEVAMRTNPVIQQAAREVEGARGVAIQAGLYPNPVMGYETDTLGQAGVNKIRTAGQQGGFVEQLIKTPGKLRLARLAAQFDVEITQKKLKQAEADVQAQVRAQYFAVLSARTNFQVTQSLAKLTDEVYNVLLLQLQVGEVAAYEPMQTRVLAMQSRGMLVQARNRYVSAWRQLAAAIGVPDMPLTELAGRIDMPVPYFERDPVLQFVLANHTDILNARYSVEKAQALLRLAEIQPIPDMAARYVMQRDMTTPPYYLTQNIAVGFALPLFDRNQGNIQLARAMQYRAMQEEGRVRNDLSAKVADAFERYDNNRVLLKMYKETMLPNQVQAFRAAVARHAALGDKNVSYNDLVTAQQTLASLINNYLTALSDQWIAVVDIGHLLQTRDLFQAQRVDEVAPIPDLHELYRRGGLHRRR